MRRRAFLEWLGTAPFAATAATSGPRRVAVMFFRVPRATLHATTPAFYAAAALRDGMRELGWTEGRDMAFNWRSAEGQRERIPVLLRELVDSGVDVLALSGNNIIEPAMRITTKIPIVMLASYSPVESGLVASLARPGGNVTGMALNSEEELLGKRMELLKEAAPVIQHLAHLHDTSIVDAKPAAALASRLRLKLLPYPVGSAGDLHEAMRRAVRSGADSVAFDSAYAVEPSAHQEIRTVVEKYRLPMIHRFRSVVVAGSGLMSYAPNPVAYYRRACAMIDRILKGERPGEIPVEVVNQYYFDLNLRLAESIGWKIPPAVVARADNVIR